MPDQKISELISLYNEVKKLSEENKIGKDSITFYQNMNLMIGTYTMMRDSFSPDQFEQVYRQMKEHLQLLIENLRKESIDHKLQSENLSEQEINELLDKKLEQLKNQ